MKKNKEKNNVLSIIVPTKGVTDYLERTINSVLSQTYNDIELILVGNNDVEKISKNYEGYIFANSNTFGKDDIIDIPMEPLILTVDGNITYS